MALSVDRHREALFDRFASRVESPNAFRDLLVGDHEGWDNAHDIVACGNEEELMLQSGVSERGRGDLQLEADHQPFAANLINHIVMPILELRQPLAHVQTEPRDPLEEAW